MLASMAGATTTEAPSIKNTDTVGFGKHAELTYQELWDSEPAYCLWSANKFRDLVAQGAEQATKFEEGDSRLKRLAQWVIETDELLKQQGPIFEYNADMELVERPGTKTLAERIAEIQNEAKGKFYGVAYPEPGRVYSSWGECRAAVQGVKGVIYKSFPSEEEALEYVRNPPPRKVRASKSSVSIEGAPATGDASLEGKKAAKVSKRERAGAGDEGEKKQRAKRVSKEGKGEDATSPSTPSAPAPKKSKGKAPTEPNDAAPAVEDAGSQSTPAAAASKRRRGKSPKGENAEDAGSQSTPAAAASKRRRGKSPKGENAEGATSLSTPAASAPKKRKEKLPKGESNTVDSADCASPQPQPSPAQRRGRPSSSQKKGQADKSPQIEETVAAVASDGAASPKTSSSNKRKAKAKAKVINKMALSKPLAKVKAKAAAAKKQKLKKAKESIGAKVVEPSVSTPSSASLAPEAAAPARSKAAAKAGAKRAADATQPSIDEAVLKAAEGYGLRAALTNLASRPDVLKEAFSPEKLLEALRQSDGLVNKAKEALLRAVGGVDPMTPTKDAIASENVTSPEKSQQLQPRMDEVEANHAAAASKAQLTDSQMQRIKENRERALARKTLSVEGTA